MKNIKQELERLYNGTDLTRLDRPRKPRVFPAVWLIALIIVVIITCLKSIY